MANYQLGLRQKAPYTVVGIVALDPTDVLTVLASDSNAVKIDSDATPQSPDPLALGTGFIVASAVTDGVIITATLTKADGSHGSSEVAIDVVQDVSVVPQITLSLGPAVAQ